MSLRITTLDNGLRVVSDPMEGLETTALGVWVDIGARCETAESNGVSHFLEHMAFKGTRRRSAKDIAEEIEAVGGHLNAYTSRENTAYVARVLKEHVPLAVDILGDILLNSTIPPDEVERERQVIIQEIGQTQDAPDDLVFDLFQEGAYPDQPLGRSILGSSAGVERMTRDSIAGYMEENYGADRMVVVASGRVEHGQFASLCEDAFGDLPQRGPFKTEPARYAGSDLCRQRDLEQAHLVIGLNGVAYEDSDYYATQVLATVLGGGMSSRLFQEVRETRGLAYSIYAFTSSYVDGGLFGVYAGCGEDDVEETANVVCDEIVKICAGAEEAETDRARAQLKAGLLMSLESPAARCEQIARQMLIFGRPIPGTEIIERIDAVEAESLSRVARRLIEGGATNLAALGPVAGIADGGRIRNRSLLGTA